MDTVTESQTAIAMALMGGLGVLHKNLSIEQQAAEVRRVKKHQHAVITHPVTVLADQTVAELRSIMETTGITGFPVIDSSGVLVGMCTSRDVRYHENDQDRVSTVMSAPARSLPAGATREQAMRFFRENRVEKLPLIDAQGKLKGLMTSRDLRQATHHPEAVRDSRGSLTVAAAIGVGSVEGLERAQALVQAGVDCLVVDSAHGHSDGVMSTVRQIKKQWPELTIIGGNVATSEGAVALLRAGADVIKVGIGPGSICTTRIVSGVGVPQFTAVWEASRAAAKYRPEAGVIADGGIRYSGDVTKALAAGAHAVMIGSLFAGTDESPGETILYMGRSYKLYRGMGSLGAMKKGGKERYRQGDVRDDRKLVPEGVEAKVPHRGSLAQVVHQLVGGLRAGMGYVGARDLKELREKSRFRRITTGGLRESHVHDVSITAEAPNYSSGMGGE
jgi:IMP dehydrogenase